MKKKLLALLLAMVMVLSLSAAVFAEEQDLTDYQDKQPTISKTYKVNNGTAPEETFTFTFTGVSYKNGDGETVAEADIPTINAATIHFDAISEDTTNTVTLNIDPEVYNLGVYTYKVVETAGSTAGVTYDDAELYLVLTILRDEDSGKHFVAAMHYEAVDGSKKSDENIIVNEYDSGSLSVTKQIAGNMADMDKEFVFTVAFNAPEGKTVKSSISTTDGMTVDSVTYNENGSADAWTTATYTFKLGDGATMTFSNLPEGVTYTVSENAENYTASTSDVTGDIAANDEDKVEIINTLTNEIDTGITVDSLPYILLLGVVAVAAVVLFSTKRLNREN